MIRDHYELRQRIDDNCAVGSNLVCFDAFFPPNSDWVEERFVVTDLPRQQTSWRLIHRPSINSNPDELLTLTVHKYTRREPMDNRSRYDRRRSPRPISYAAFYDIHSLGN